MLLNLDHFLPQLAISAIRLHALYRLDRRMRLSIIALYFITNLTTIGMTAQQVTVAYGM